MAPSGPRPSVAVACLAIALVVECAKHREAPAGTSTLPDTIQLGPIGGMADVAGLGGPRPDLATARAEEVLVPVGRWVRRGEFTGYTYVDPEKGLSVAGEIPLPASLQSTLQVEGVATMHTIARLAWRSPDLRVLSEEERVAAGLPEVPDWLANYGPQAPAGTLWGIWRLDPRLRDRFHPEYPDDLEVLFDDSPPSGQGFEIMWVRIDHCAADRCRGTNLNTPFHLKHPKSGEEVWFRADRAQPGHYLLVEGLEMPPVPYMNIVPRPDPVPEAPRR